MQILPIGEKVNTEYGVFEIIDYDNIEESYLCYQQGFDGHSGIGHFDDKYLNTKYDRNCWWFDADEVSLIEESKVHNLDKQPKFKVGDKILGKSNKKLGMVEGDIYTVRSCTNQAMTLEECICRETGYYYTFTPQHYELFEENKDYRKMKPTDLIDITLDGKEFKVPLGDLVHAKALMGVTNGLYGFDLYKAFDKLFNGEGFIEDYDTVINFKDKQKEVLDHFFKPHFDEKEKKELEAQIVTKSNELLELQEKLKDLQS